jgi:hypothetical protein
MLRYYKGTATLGITYTSNGKTNVKGLNNTVNIKAYSDSAFSDNKEKKASAGYVITIAEGVVLYKSYC